MFIVASNDGPWDSTTVGAIGIVRDSSDLQQFVEDRNGPQELYHYCSGSKCQARLNEIGVDCLVDGTIIAMYYQEDDKIYVMVAVDPAP
jgi:hypothetical protein